MLRNIGIVDQVIRAIVGLTFIALTAQAWVSGATVLVSAIAGGYLLVTAIFLYCPIYAVLGLSTFGRLDRSA